MKKIYKALWGLYHDLNLPKLTKLEQWLYYKAIGVY